MSLGILFAGGPGHWLAHIAAGGKERFGKIKARTNNYVDSGKAAEHATKVGNAIKKAPKILLNTSPNIRTKSEKPQNQQAVSSERIPKPNKRPLMRHWRQNTRTGLPITQTAPTTNNPGTPTLQKLSMSL